MRECGCSLQLYTVGRAHRVGCGIQAGVPCLAGRLCTAGGSVPVGGAGRVSPHIRPLSVAQHMVHMCVQLSRRLLGSSCLNRGECVHHSVCGRVWRVLCSAHPHHTVCPVGLRPAPEVRVSSFRVCCCQCGSGVCVCVLLAPAVSVAGLYRSV